MTNKILAAGSVALMGAGALVGATPAQAYTDADCGLDGTDYIGGLFDGTTDVCWAIALGPGDYTFTAPANTVALEAVLGGAGGGAGSYGYGYGGNGGEIVFIDELEPTQTLEISLGAGGDGGAGGPLTAGADGEDSTIDNGVDIYTAHGGSGGEYVSGASGSGNAYGIASDEWTQNGGGAKTAGTADAAGVGYDLHDPELVGADNPLFPGDYVSIYGSGGSGSESDGHNWGYGGDASYDAGSDTWTLEDGESGFAYITYKLGTPLASTGVNTVPMGALAAGMFVAGGAGLAIARRARRSK
jgi:hypothetical protein